MLEARDFILQVKHNVNRKREIVLRVLDVYLQLVIIRRGEVSCVTPTAIFLGKKNGYSFRGLLLESSVVSVCYM